MGWAFRAATGVAPFSIDQTVFVRFTDDRAQWLDALLGDLREELDPDGGTVGILTSDAFEPLGRREGVDAMLNSNENELA